VKEKVFFIILAVAIFLATASLAHAWTDAEGFLGLKWGMSEEEARKVFNDLKLKDKRSESPDVLQPWNGYVRENETFQLGELPADEVKYVFSEKGLGAVVARATFMDLNRSSVPGTYSKLKEKFASSYVVLKKQFVSVYGEPELEETEFHYTCRWKLKQTNIMLSFTSNGENYINLVLCYSYKPEAKVEIKTNPQKKK
jgi:hypothetical protein